MRWPSVQAWCRVFAVAALCTLALPFVVLGAAELLQSDTRGMAFGVVYSLLVIVPCSVILAVLAIASLTIRVVQGDCGGRIWWVPVAAAAAWVLFGLGLFLTEGL